MLRNLVLAALTAVIVADCSTTRYTQFGNMMEDTGGDWLYFQPFLSADIFVRPSYAVQALIGGRVPLMQNVRGTQLVESPAVSLGLAQTVRF